MYDNPNGETTNGTYKEYTVRVANNTTPAKCNDSNSNFSQTACGFVVEFVDIVEKRQMNSSSKNDGGWRDSKMRTYANNKFYNKLPEELRNVIKSTKVVSGHGSNDKNNERTDGNWESTDNIYLLSGKEVLNYDRDTAYNQTRQLDYYAEKGVTIRKNISYAIKQYNSSNFSWWLREANSSGYTDFLSVNSDGSWDANYASYNTGFAPAFRIG